MARSRFGWRVHGLAVALAMVAALVAAPAVAQDAGPVIRMNSLTFDPVTVHVTPGTTVTWTNPSNVEHTVTADDSLFDSGNVEPGDTWSMEFDDPGTYQYFCQQHGEPGLQDMAGVIIVDG